MHNIEIMLSGVAAGLVGALAMNLFLRWVSATFDEPVNMIKVVGSYVTGSEQNSVQVGTLVHLSTGAIFGIIYAFVLHAIHAGFFPAALFAGFGFGFGHGLITSYGLMFFVAEKHPISRYRRATFAIGVLYLIAHVIFGGVVGLIVSLANFFIN